MATPTSIKGVATTLMVGSDPVVAEAECSLEVNGEIIDITTKDSAEWREILMGVRDWKMIFSALYAATDAVRTAAMAAWAAGTPLTATFTVGTDTYSGAVYVGSVKFSAPLKDMTKEDFTLEGTGALTLPA